MRVTTSGRVRNYVAFASATLEATDDAALCVCGVDKAIAKATSVVEILKRTCPVPFVQTTTLSRTADGKPQIELHLSRS